MRVLIADDSAIERAIVRRFVEASGHEVAGEAVDAAGAIESALRLLPDVVVLDGRLPPAGGLSALAALRALASPPLVVVIASLSERAFLATAMRSGAQAGVMRPLAAGELAETLARLARTS